MKKHFVLLQTIFGIHSVPLSVQNRIAKKIHLIKYIIKVLFSQRYFSKFIFLAILFFINDGKWLAKSNLQETIKISKSVKVFIVAKSYVFFLLIESACLHLYVWVDKDESDSYHRIGNERLDLIFKIICFTFQMFFLFHTILLKIAIQQICNKRQFLHKHNLLFAFSKSFM